MVKTLKAALENYKRDVLRYHFLGAMLTEREKQWGRTALAHINRGARIAAIARALELTPREKEKIDAEVKRAVARKVRSG